MWHNLAMYGKDHLFNCTHTAHLKGTLNIQRMTRRASNMLRVMARDRLVDNTDLYIHSSNDPIFFPYFSGGSTKLKRVFQKRKSGLDETVKAGRYNQWAPVHASLTSSLFGSSPEQEIPDGMAISSGQKGSKAQGVGFLSSEATALHPRLNSSPMSTSGTGVDIGHGWHGYGFWLQVRIEVRLMAASTVVPRFWTSPTLFSSSRLILPPFVIAPPSSRQSSSPVLLSAPLTHRVEDSAIITSFNSNIVWPREHRRDRRRAEFNVMADSNHFFCVPAPIRLAPPPRAARSAACKHYFRFLDASQTSGIHPRYVAAHLLPIKPVLTSLSAATHLQVQL
ncbi:hypothetical protein B0H13DRAFT_1873929 [Mycena leptocephala]|nr:hypothetical protein B0H13DRAFT_1873929 [Mycena leptocephala]